MKDDWKMPHVEVGDRVLFSRDPSGSQGWTFGFVEEVSERNICCWVPRCPENWFRDNVRHVSDPIWQNERKRNAMLEDNDSGVFVIHPKDQAFEVMKQDYARLRALVEQLVPGGLPPAPHQQDEPRNKGGRPKGAKNKPKEEPKDGPAPVTGDHLKPAVYDEIPEEMEGSQILEIEEDEEVEV